MDETPQMKLRSNEWVGTWNVAVGSARDIELSRALKDGTVVSVPTSGKLQSMRVGSRTESGDTAHFSLTDPAKSKPAGG